MQKSENKIYFEKIEEIKDKVYKLFNLSGREDLVMVYNMQENQIYSFIFKEFYESINDRSKQMLIKQYMEAKQANKIVLFIKDELREKFKSFTI